MTAYSWQIWTWAPPSADLVEVTIGSEKMKRLLRVALTVPVWNLSTWEDEARGRCVQVSPSYTVGSHPVLATKLDSASNSTESQFKKNGMCWDFVSL